MEAEMDAREFTERCADIKEYIRKAGNVHDAQAAKALRAIDAIVARGFQPNAAETRAFHSARCEARKAVNNTPFSDTPAAIIVPDEEAEGHHDAELAHVETASAALHA
jgi:hypothetical protein